MPNNPNLMNESELPEGLEFVNRAPIVTGGAAAPPQDFDKYQGAVVSAIGLSPDTVDSQLPGHLPVFRLMPASLAGNPATNAAIQSTAGKVAEATPPAVAPAVAPSTGLTSVGLDMPPAFTVTNSPLTSNGTIDVAWAPEPPGYFLAAAPAGLTSLAEVTNSQGNNNSSATEVATITSTPPSTVSSGWFLYTSVSAGASYLNPSGLTQHGNLGTANFSTDVPVTYTETGNDVYTFVNTLLTFSGSQPAFVQYATGSLNSSLVGSASFGSNTTAGDALIVILKGVGTPSNELVHMTFTDSGGNLYSLVSANLIASASGNNGWVQEQVYICPSCVGGADTISVTGSGHFGGGASYTVEIYEFGSLGSGLAYPIFRPISPSDLPAINASLIAGGQVSPKFGGTGSNLGATGGTSEVLLQTTVGGNITVRQLDFSDLEGVSPATMYNNAMLVGLGLPSEIQNEDSLNHVADISVPLSLGAPTASGPFRINFYMITTAAATASGTLPDIYFTWTDPEINATCFADYIPSNPTANTVGNLVQGVAYIYAKAGQDIYFQTGVTTPYASVGVTHLEFSVHIRMEQL